MDENSVVAIPATVILLLAYYGVGRSPSLRAGEQTLAGVVLRRLAGFLLFGVLGAIAARLFLPFSLEELGLTPFVPPSTWLWVGGASLLMVPACFAFSPRADNCAVYPEIRLSEWRLGTVIANSLSVALYLLGYEFLFRGLLLFACLSEMAPPFAIAINVALYAGAHIPKGAKEALGSLPFGILLCLATIETGAIWAAFLIHLILSQTNDYVALRANPSMRLVLRGVSR